MFENIFANKKINFDKLSSYGFTKDSDGFKYAAFIMGGQFELCVSVSESGTVSTKMKDCETNEDYSLYKVSSPVGGFIEEVRTACEDVLSDIAKKCCEDDVFHFAGTHAVIEYVRQKYGDELEFLWDKFPDNAIWRRKDNKKWYGLVITISKRKLGLDSDDIVEAINLKLPPEEIVKSVDNIRYFPGWHMNKKSWCTIILDGSVPASEIFDRIDVSYSLARK